MPVSAQKPGTTPYRNIIDLIAPVHALDPNLIEAMAIIESSGHADAFRFEPEFYAHYLRGNREYDGLEPRRIASSYGLLQIMYTTARQVGFQGEPEELFLPAQSLEYGCRYLHALHDWAEGDIWKAVAAYNGGKGNWNGDLPQAYARKVQAMLEQVRIARGWIPGTELGKKA